MRQFRSNYLFILIVLLLTFSFDFFSSCTNFKENKEEIESLDSITVKPIDNIIGQLYIFAPELDSATCEATGNCDCCSSNLLFLDDSIFVAVDYCLDIDTYYKGKYKIKDSTISFISNSLRVDKEVNWEAEVDTMNKEMSAYFIKTRKDKIIEFKWASFHFKNKLCFKTSFGDFSTPDKGDKKDFINATKEDSVWYKLNL